MLPPSANHFTNDRIPQEINGGPCQHNCVLERFNEKHHWQKKVSTETILELSKVECAWEKCQEQQTKLRLDEEIKAFLEGAAVSPEVIEAEQSIVGEDVLEIRSLIKVLQRCLTAANNRPAEAVSNSESEEEACRCPRSSGVKLSKITLPWFSVKYNEWLPFHDLFVSTVDNNRALSVIQKPSHLMTWMRGEPARLLSLLPASNAHYQVAFFLERQLWQPMYDDYSYALRSDLQIQGLDSRITWTALQVGYFLRREYNGTQSFFGLDLESSPDYLRFYCMAEKLDSETHLQWEFKTNNN